VTVRMVPCQAVSRPSRCQGLQATEASARTRVTRTG